jgi:hypothetical protein
VLISILRFLVYNFIIFRPHYHWSLDVNYLLLLHRYVIHALWLLHVYWLPYWPRLHDILDRHLLYHLWLLLKLWGLLNWLLFYQFLLCLSFSFDVLLMRLQVTGEVELGKESPLAVLAVESLLALMDLHMLVQVCLLSESVVALREIALVRSLLGVDSQMVEEVVPFPEHFGALTVGAAQQPYDSSGLCAFVLIDHEVLGAWDVLLDTNLVKIKVLSMLNCNGVVVWDNFSIGELSIDVKVELLLDLGLR